MSSSLNNLLRLAKERLQANERLLSMLPPGSIQHNDAILRQRAVFLQGLGSMPLMPEDDALELCEEVARVGWPSHAVEIAAIMDHVVPAAELRLFGQPLATRTQ